MRKFPFLKDFRQRQGAAGGFLLDAEEGIPSELGGHAGVYVIEASDNFKFPYPTGNSKVIYIGKADDLRARLKQHRHRLNQLIDTDGKYAQCIKMSTLDSCGRSGQGGRWWTTKAGMLGGAGHSALESGEVGGDAIDM